MNKKHKNTPKEVRFLKVKKPLLKEKEEQTKILEEQKKFIKFEKRQLVEKATENSKTGWWKIRAMEYPIPRKRAREDFGRIKGDFKKACKTKKLEKRND